MVVLGGELLLAKGALGKPLDKLDVPRLEAGKVRLGPGSVLDGVEDGDGVQDVGVLLGEVDDANRAALERSAGPRTPPPTVFLHGTIWACKRCGVILVLSSMNQVRTFWAAFARYLASSVYHQARER